MIQSRWVFQDGYRPDLVHRHSERQELSRALEPAMNGERAEDVLIYGPSGVGKTVTTRSVLRTLREEGGITSTIVPCSGGTVNEILHQALIGHPTEVATHEYYPTQELLNKLRNITTRPYVLVLDEADIVPDLEILNDLYQVPKLSVVAIAHDRRHWLNRLDDDLQDYFGYRAQIEFDRYTTCELVDILKPRAEKGLEPDVVIKAQLEWIADEVAGVARYGLLSVLSAAELAEERGHDRFHERDVADSFSRARRKMREANLRSLPFGHLVVYELLRLEGGQVRARRIHELYERYAPSVYADRDHDPVGKRSVTSYLSKLVDYNLVEKDGESRWAMYEVIDPELEAPIELGIEARIE